MSFLFSLEISMTAAIEWRNLNRSVVCQGREFHLNTIQNVAHCTQCHSDRSRIFWRHIAILIDRCMWWWMDGCCRIYGGSILTRLEEGFGWAEGSIVQVDVRLNEHYQVLVCPLEGRVTLTPPLLRIEWRQKSPKNKFTGPEIFVFWRCQFNNQFIQ